MKSKTIKPFIYVVVLSFLFSCTTKYQTLKDIKETPQNAYAFVKSDKPLINRDFQLLIDRYFDKIFFSPWERSKSFYSKKTAFWGFNVYPYREVYGENRKRISKEWFRKLKLNADIKNFPSLSLKGITITNTDMKVFPTSKPIFYSFDKAGEGFPFDYNQNTLIHAGTPVYISHISKDKQWFFVETSFAAGWVKSNDIGLIDTEIQDIYKTGTYVAVVKDNVSIVDEDGIFRFKAMIGSIFPLVDEEKDYFVVYIPVRDIDGFTVLTTAKIPKEYAVIKPWILKEKNIAKVINETIGKPYGWGGLFYNRDCSANIRDIFVPFGIWLPRNSYAQAKSGIFVSVDGLTEDEKENFIKKSAIPFLTLIWMRGHIMLYIGTKDGKPYVFHNFWGIKTRVLNKEGRVIVGKAAITSLRPEKDVFFADRYRTFLKRIKGITYIIPPKYLLR